MEPGMGDSLPSTCDTGLYKWDLISLREMRDSFLGTLTVKQLPLNRKLNWVV